MAKKCYFILYFVLIYEDKNKEMVKITFITGASGSGKTTLKRSIEQNIAKDSLKDIALFEFDDIGVPESWEGIDGQQWQRDSLEKWIDKIEKECSDYSEVIIDGSVRILNIKEIFEKRGITDYSIVLVDCNDEARKGRLIERGQGELATEDMMNYARQFRNEARDFGVNVIDNSTYEPKETMRIFNSISRKCGETK